jgi:uncharacterized protein (TIGR02611 family)
MGEPRPAIERLRRRKELHRQRNRFYRVAVAVVGFLVLLFGIVLVLPGVPGPGILLIGLGLAILALEFDRAERLLERILDRVEAARERTSALQEAVIAVVGLLAIAAYVVAAILWDIPILPG